MCSEPLFGTLSVVTANCSSLIDALVISACTPLANLKPTTRGVFAMAMPSISCRCSALSSDITCTSTFGAGGGGAAAASVKFAMATLR
jgi:hypothetical protein